MGTVYLGADLNLGLNTPDHLDTRDEGGGQKGTRAREEVERYTGNEAWGGGGGRQDVKTGTSCSFCCISYVIQFVFQEENLLMTILCAALKGREFLSPGKVAVGDGG